MDNMYEVLTDRKRKGIKLDFKELDYDTLYDLFINHGIPDALIAQLYDVDKKMVKKKRHEYGIKQYSGISDKVELAIKDYIKSSAYNDAVKEISATIETPNLKPDYEYLKNDMVIITIMLKCLETYKAAEANLSENSFKLLYNEVFSKEIDKRINLIESICTC